MIGLTEFQRINTWKKRVPQSQIFLRNVNFPRLNFYENRHVSFSIFLRGTIIVIIVMLTNIKLELAENWHFMPGNLTWGNSILKMGKWVIDCECLELLDYIRIDHKMFKFNIQSDFFTHWLILRWIPSFRQWARHALVDRYWKAHYIFVSFY